MRLVVSMGLSRDGVRRPALRELDWPHRASRDLWWDPDPAWTAQAEDQFAVPFRDGDQLIQPSRTAVVTISLPRWRVEEAWSHPLLCDVHSAAPRPGGGWLLTSTGIEAVLEVEEGAIVARHDLRDAPADRDFRQVPHDFARPHASHPSFAFWQDGVWVTEFAAQRCRRLDGWASHAFPEGPVHDGVVREGLRWFTTVTGHVLGLDPVTWERRVHLDLNLLAGTRRRLGWCRGVEVVGDRCFVGMTSLRSSTWREVARWVVRGEAGIKLPTRVIELDWKRGELVSELPVGDGVIYAITAW